MNLITIIEFFDTYNWEANCLNHNHLRYRKIYFINIDLMLQEIAITFN